MLITQHHTWLLTLVLHPCTAHPTPTAHPTLHSYSHGHFTAIPLCSICAWTLLLPCSAKILLVIPVFPNTLMVLSFLGRIPPAHRALMLSITPRITNPTQAQPFPPSPFTAPSQVHLWVFPQHKLSVLTHPSTTHYKIPCIFHPSWLHPHIWGAPIHTPQLIPQKTPRIQPNVDAIKPHPSPHHNHDTLLSRVSTALITVKPLTLAFFFWRGGGSLSHHPLPSPSLLSLLLGLFPLRSHSFPPFPSLSLPRPQPPTQV